MPRLNHQVFKRLPLRSVAAFQSFLSPVFRTLILTCKDKEHPLNKNTCRWKTQIIRYVRGRREKKGRGKGKSGGARGEKSEIKSPVRNC